MPENKAYSLPRGGFHKPVATLSFIIEHLASMGEDYIENIHRAYRAALIEAALASGKQWYNDAGKLKGKPYHRTTIYSFRVEFAKLTDAGKVEFSGREEESDDPRFVNWPERPMRRYYRLAAGITPEPHVEKKSHKPEHIPEKEQPESEKPIRITVTGELPIDRGRTKKGKAK